MATNSYFNNFNQTAEQDLIEDLNIEALKMYGFDIMYLPRTLGAEDTIFNEDRLPEFNSIYPIEVYIKNVDNFEGEGDFLSKFGLQIRDSITFTVSNKRFNEEIGTPESIPRPREGDLIYFPLNEKMFEIMHTEHESVFYQLGKLYVYDMKCELMEYSDQRFNTGNTTIDELFTDYVKTSNSAISNVDTVDSISDNYNYETEGNDILDFSVENPFGSDTY